jgi:predicted RNA binding protein YcfA (HicA-like mRNA interferase family)
MTAKFPRMSSAEIIRLLHEHGFIDVRQRGSHLILFHPSSRRHVTVPVGKKDVPIGTAKSIFRSAGIEQ